MSGPSPGMSHAGMDSLPHVPNHPGASSHLRFSSSRFNACEKSTGRALEALSSTTLTLSRMNERSNLILRRPRDEGIIDVDSHVRLSAREAAVHVDPQH